MSNEEFIAMCEAKTDKEFAILCAESERESMDSFIAEMSAEAELRSSAIDTLIELEMSRRQKEEEEIGFSMSPNRANLEQFYPEVTIPMRQWFSLLNEIEESPRRERNNLDTDFAGEEFDLPPINWSQEEDDEGADEEQEEQAPLCQPIFEAPIPLGDCPICLNELQMVDFTVTKCGHSFHASCLLRSVEDSSDCPMCRNQLTKQKNRTNYDDIEWVEYEGEGTEVDDEEGTEVDDEEVDDEEERRVPSFSPDNEPHWDEPWDEPSMSPEAIAERKRKDEEFTAFARTFLGRTSHSIFIQAQDTYGEAHACFAKSNAFRAAGDHWNGHKYQCRFAELIEKGHRLMRITERPRPDDDANNYAWQTNRKTITYLDPSAPAKDFLSTLFSKREQEQPKSNTLDINIDLD